MAREEWSVASEVEDFVRSHVVPRTVDLAFRLLSCSRIEWARVIPSDTMTCIRSTAIPELEAAITGSRHAIAGSFSAMPGVADASLTSLSIRSTRTRRWLCRHIAAIVWSALGNSNGWTGQSVSIDQSTYGMIPWGSNVVRVDR